MLATAGQAAFATARFAITPTRCARYSALAWMSPFSPSAGVLIPAIASGEKFADSACLHRRLAEHAALARAGHRDAHAGRDFATNTPTIA